MTSLWLRNPSQIVHPSLLPQNSFFSYGGGSNRDLFGEYLVGKSFDRSPFPRNQNGSSRMGSPQAGRLESFWSQLACVELWSFIRPHLELFWHTQLDDSRCNAIGCAGSQFGCRQSSKDFFLNCSSESKATRMVVVRSGHGQNLFGMHGRTRPAGYSGSLNI